LQENRRSLRFECRETLIFQHGGKTYEATVLDISRGGARLSCSKKLPVGSKVFLRLKDRTKGRAPVKAVVRWRGGEAPFEMGLEFRDSTSKLSRRWVRKLFPDQGAAWTAGHQQRSEVRAQVSLPVVSANGFIEGTTLDISQGGACFELDQKLEDTVGLFFCLPWSLLEVRANVLRAESRGSKWVHSVRFSPLKEEQQAELEAFVEHAI
jgi:PilZ domain